MTSDDYTLCKNVVLYLNLADKFKNTDIEKKCYKEATSRLLEASSKDNINFSQLLKLEHVFFSLEKPKTQNTELQKRLDKKIELVEDAMKSFSVNSNPSKLITNALEAGKDAETYLKNYDVRGLPLDGLRKFFTFQKKSLAKQLDNQEPGLQKDFLEARRTLVNKAEEKYMNYQRVCIEKICEQKPDLFITKAYIGYNPQKQKEIRQLQRNYQEQKELKKQARAQAKEMER